MNYTKFVLIHAPRSGSNFLMSKIQSHPNTATFSEIFNANDKSNEYQNFCHALALMDVTIERAISIRELNQSTFLNEVIFKEDYPDFIEAVGFKITYEDLFNNKDVMNYILENDSVKVIHLIRENLFDIYISFRRALLTKQWVIHRWTSPNLSDELSFHVDVKQCEIFFTNLEQMRSHVQELYKNKNTLELEYCDLVEGIWEPDLQNHLRLSKADLAANVSKNQKINHSLVIENYQEVQNYFKNSQWSTFFSTSP
ncbi:hypothetical protein [Ekhidna sp.]|uniref:hypothetical protein n=1 Tax=Ekhidna sp. TaxID=2608089 RepID=UPI003298B27C